MEHDGLFRILLVDDEPYTREGLKNLIDWQAHGFAVCGEAGDGRSAVELVARLRPHVVITDIRMPEMDGLELIRKTRQDLGLDCLFIVLSGYNEFAYAQTAMRFDVKHYILKPIDEQELARALDGMRTEIDRGIRHERERQESALALAPAVLQKLMRGKPDGDAAGYAGKWLDCRDGDGMLFLMAEVLERPKDGNLLEEARRRVEKTLGTDRLPMMLEEETTRYYILVNSDTLMRRGGSVAGLCRMLLKSVSADGRLRAAVYAGGRQDRLDRLHLSFQSCLAARERNFFDRREGILYHEQEDGVNALNYHIQDIACPALSEAVEAGREADIPAAVGSMFESMRLQRLAPEAVRVCLVGYMAEMVRAVSAVNGDAGNLLERFRADSMEDMAAPQLQEYMLEFCLECARCAKAGRDGNTRGLMADVERYVQRNYKGDISLKAVAEHFYINPIYLGQLFRKSLGVYFNDYVNRLRVEEAERLLKGTDLKIREIAERVGYADPDYFIRKFRKLRGLNPSQYRNGYNPLCYH